MVHLCSQAGLRQARAWTCKENPEKWFLVGRHTAALGVRMEGHSSSALGQDIVTSKRLAEKRDFKAAALQFHPQEKISQKDMMYSEL